MLHINENVDTKNVRNRKQFFRGALFSVRAKLNAFIRLLLKLFYTCLMYLLKNSRLLFQFSSDRYLTLIEEIEHILPYEINIQQTDTI